MSGVTTCSCMRTSRCRATLRAYPSSLKRSSLNPTDAVSTRPLDVAAIAWTAGIRTFIVLDLARVGARAGPETEPARRLRSHLPEAEIVLGGGVRGADDLRALAVAGYDAALVGTALHIGILGAADLIVPA